MTSNFFSLNGKTAVITGGIGGFGGAAAKRFSAAGAKVVISDIRDGADFAASIGGLYVPADVSKEADVEALMQAAIEEFGGLDIVINNAGICRDAPITDITKAEIDPNIMVNFYGVLWGMKHGARLIRDGGAFVNTASYAGLFGTPSYPAYGGSKAGVIGITRATALELAPRGIRVNAVCPGTHNNAMADEVVELGKVEEALAEVICPLGRLGTPEEVAALYHFLASDEAAFITGQAIAIDGGLSAGPSMQLIEHVLGASL